MKLNVKERLLLQGILPKENNFVTLKIVRKLQEALSFNEDEIKTYAFETYKSETEKDMIKWNQEIEQEKEIEIGEKATDIIADALKELDKNKKLTNDHFDLYEKFVKE